MIVLVTIEFNDIIQCIFIVFGKPQHPPSTYPYFSKLKNLNCLSRTQNSAITNAIHVNHTRLLLCELDRWTNFSCVVHYFSRVGNKVKFIFSETPPKMF